MKKIILILVIIVVTSDMLLAQCYPNRHNTNWYDGWVSCMPAENPNPERMESHWILFKMGYPIISRNIITLRDELSGKSNGI